jgi:hypothetical protein
MSQEIDRPPLVTADRVISMTELQKLSLRKLREMRLDRAPLVVRDVKRDRRWFVILDHATYGRLAGGPEDRPPKGLDLREIDFCGQGLLWDRPSMTNERFAEILADPGEPEHPWAWGRAFERLPSRLLTRAVGLEQLRRIVSVVSVRPRLRRAWEGAIDFWSAEARRRRV